MQGLQLTAAERELETSLEQQIKARSDKFDNKIRNKLLTPGERNSIAVKNITPPTVPFVPTDLSRKVPDAMSFDDANFLLPERPDENKAKYKVEKAKEYTTTQQPVHEDDLFFSDAILGRKDPNIGSAYSRAKKVAEAQNELMEAKRMQDEVKNSYTEYMKQAANPEFVNNPDLQDHLSRQVEEAKENYREKRTNLRNVRHTFLATLPEAIYSNENDIAVELQARAQEEREFERVANDTTINDATKKMYLQRLQRREKVIADALLSPEGDFIKPELVNQRNISMVPHK
jgi:hypothetical protein